MKVRCVGCKEWVLRDGCIPYGLSWCCNEGCRWKAIRRQQKKVAEHKEKIAKRGYKIARPKPKAVTRNDPSSERKEYVRQRDGKRCRMCGTDKSLHVHHIRYKSEGGKHGERNLVTLCLTCHDRVHGQKRHWQPVLVELIRYHYEEGLFLTVPEVERRFYGERIAG